MRLVVFGLTISSSWANGHATLWRGLCAALAARGHHVIFFERDVPYYAQHRDLTALAGGTLRLYDSWAAVRSVAATAVAAADAAIVTSYCPDAREACALVLQASGMPVFYDLDTPVTLARLAAGDDVEYLPSSGLCEFSLVLSYAGGPALVELEQRLGARRTAPLYGSVDVERYRPGAIRGPFVADLSYLGTYARDRQQVLDELFLMPARRMPGGRFLIGGSQYPPDFSWWPNVYYVRHVPPGDHPDFYASSRFTLNVTRAAMARMGHAPSGRLFEAAACGATLLTDAWPGLEDFFVADEEVLMVRDGESVLEALQMRPAARRRLGEAARARVLRAHTAMHRAEELERLLWPTAPTANRPSVEIAAQQ